MNGHGVRVLDKFESHSLAELAQKDLKNVTDPFS